MRPFVLTIAGHDPSGGAGINADIKVFEQLNVQGLSVCTAITIQTENKFESVNWVPQDLILAQTKLVLETYRPKVIKVGLIESIQLLKLLINIVLEFDKDTKVIWDPILSSSTGFRFHKDTTDVNSFLKNFDLITPNRPEATSLFGTDNIDAIQQSCIAENWNAVLLKGGHAESNKGDDIIITSKSIEVITGEHQHLLSEKHGTGCILSAAIAASLARTNNLYNSCVSGKRYVEQAMLSNESLLAWHSTQKS